MRLRDCVQCGAGVGYRDRATCCKCWRRAQEAAAKQACPGCGKQRRLTATGRCVTCSRVCVDCGAVVRFRDRTRCQFCHRRHELQAVLQPCAACHRPRRVDPQTGRCGTCDAARRTHPWRACATCGRPRVHRDGAQCHACWQKDDDRPFVYVAGLAGRLDEPPEWLEDFAVYAAARFCPSRAVGVLRDLGRLLDTGVSRPAALLEHACWDSRSIGPLARTLEEFFVQHRLALPLGHAEDLETRRRARRLQATPEPFRSAAAAFADAQVADRQRSRRAETRPRSHHTIDVALCAIRDLACYLVEAHPAVGGWETVSLDHVEGFLALRPGSRPRRLGALRTFFTWARRQRIILTDPTARLRTNERRRFKGPVIDTARQRTLFRRWTSTQAHPHEAFIGLLAMLHAASADELRHIHLADIDTSSRSLRLGARPQPVPLDPATWSVLQRCLDHHEALRTPNPHLLVTKITATRSTPASPYYISHMLDAVDVSVRVLRSNRLAHLIATTDPLLVIAAFGLTPAAATWYLGDTVDPDRLSNV